MEPASERKTLFGRLAELYTRLNDNYRNHKLAWDLGKWAAFGSFGAVAAVLYLLRGLDPVISVTLAAGFAAILAMAWDAFKRMNRWLPTGISALVLSVMAGLALAGDWRASMMTWFYKDEPPVTQAESREQGNLISALRSQIRTIELERQQAINERDEARTNRPDQTQRALEPGFIGMSAELQEFIGAYVAPASEGLNDIFNISTGDNDLDVVLPQFVNERLSDALREMAQAQQGNHAFYGNNGRIQEGFCEIFDAYQVKVQWFQRMLKRPINGNWFELGNNKARYSVWLDLDAIFLQQLRVFIADSRFDLMRRCVSNIGFKEIERFRP
jgi:hypothetical protein